MDFKHSLTSQLEEFCCKPDPEEPLIPSLLLAGIPPQAPTGKGLWGLSQEQNSRWDLPAQELSVCLWERNLQGTRSWSAQCLWEAFGAENLGILVSVTPGVVP